ncbi:MAG: MotA/TolQ/ExbB proton channel family protein [Myxococcales bacterium]|nr:MotA/TolQ/ExbB proton channel family protein [Myxococcales bacterium]
MDIATPIGIVVGFGLIVGAILVGGSLSSYIDIPSLLIVVGGTVAATLICEKLPNLLGAVGVVKNAFRFPPGDAVATIAKIIELSNIARREGVLALENQKIEDPFLAKAVRKAVDGLPQDEIQDGLTAELVAMKQRHQRGQKLFRFMGTTAPSMGMIGTLIGLVQMLQTLDDPAAIGPAMAVALLTTMYGAILAFLVFNPLAEKLERKSAEESANMAVVIAGIESILKGHNAMIIKDKLEARLSPKERKPETEGDAQAA